MINNDLLTIELRSITLVRHSGDEFRGRNWQKNDRRNNRIKYFSRILIYIMVIILAIGPAIFQIKYTRSKRVRLTEIIDEIYVSIVRINNIQYIKVIKVLLLYQIYVYYLRSLRKISIVYFIIELLLISLLWYKIYNSDNNKFHIVSGSINIEESLRKCRQICPATIMHTSSGIGIAILWTIFIYIRPKSIETSSEKIRAQKCQINLHRSIFILLVFILSEISLWCRYFIIWTLVFSLWHNQLLKVYSEISRNYRQVKSGIVVIDDCGKQNNILELILEYSVQNQININKINYTSSGKSRVSRSRIILHRRFVLWCKYLDVVKHGVQSQVSISAINFSQKTTEVIIADNGNRGKDMNSIIMMKLVYWFKITTFILVIMSVLICVVYGYGICNIEPVLLTTTILSATTLTHQHNNGHRKTETWQNIPVPGKTDSMTTLIQQTRKGLIRTDGISDIAAEQEEEEVDRYLLEPELDGFINARHFGGIYVVQFITVEKWIFIQDFIIHGLGIDFIKGISIIVGIIVRIITELLMEIGSIFLALNDVYYHTKCKELLFGDVNNIEVIINISFGYVIHLINILMLIISHMIQLYMCTTYIYFICTYVPYISQNININYYSSIIYKYVLHSKFVLKVMCMYVTQVIVRTEWVTIINSKSMILETNFVTISNPSAIFTEYIPRHKKIDLILEMILGTPQRLTCPSVPQVRDIIEFYQPTPAVIIIRHDLEEEEVIIIGKSYLINTNVNHQLIGYIIEDVKSYINCGITTKTVRMILTLLNSIIIEYGIGYYGTYPPTLQDFIIDSGITFHIITYDLEEAEIDRDLLQLTYTLMIINDVCNTNSGIMKDKKYGKWYEFDDDFRGDIVNGNIKLYVNVPVLTRPFFVVSATFFALTVPFLALIITFFVLIILIISCIKAVSLVVFRQVLTIDRPTWGNKVDIIFCGKLISKEFIERDECHGNIESFHGNIGPLTNIHPIHTKNIILTNINVQKMREYLSNEDASIRLVYRVSSWLLLIIFITLNLLINNGVYQDRLSYVIYNSRILSGYEYVSNGVFDDIRSETDEEIDENILIIAELILIENLNEQEQIRALVSVQILVLLIMLLGFILLNMMIVEYGIAFDIIMLTLILLIYIILSIYAKYALVYYKTYDWTQNDRIVLDLNQILFIEAKSSYLETKLLLIQTVFDYSEILLGIEENERRNQLVAIIDPSQCVLSESSANGQELYGIDESKVTINGILSSLIYSIIMYTKYVLNYLLINLNYLLINFTPSEDGRILIILSEFASKLFIVNHIKNDEIINVRILGEPELLNSIDAFEYERREEKKNEPVNLLINSLLKDELISLGKDTSQWHGICPYVSERTSKFDIILGDSMNYKYLPSLRFDGQILIIDQVRNKSKLYYELLLVIFMYGIIFMYGKIHSHITWVLAQQDFESDNDSVFDIIRGTLVLLIVINELYKPITVPTILAKYIGLFKLIILVMLCVSIDERVRIDEIERTKKYVVMILITFWLIKTLKPIIEILYIHNTEDSLTNDGIILGVSSVDEFNTISIDTAYYGGLAITGIMSDNV